MQTKGVGGLVIILGVCNLGDADKGSWGLVILLGACLEYSVCSLLTLGAHAHSEGYSSCRVCMCVCVCVCVCV